ncbi:MAG: hypothetical protein J6586_00195 [Snodgrassella sp.]|nr:hypothetical protein [Snodgrassella sp.]
MSQNSVLEELAAGMLYDSNETTIMVDGHQIRFFGEDSMFTFAFDNDRVTVKQDPQGSAVASKNNKTGATITLNVSELSPSFQFLLGLANRQAFPGFPVDIITSTIQISASHCYITKIPDISGGNEAGNIAWQIKALNADVKSVN